MNKGFFLTDAQKMHKDNSDSFWFLSDKEINNLAIGDFVKVCINNSERVWLKIVDIDFKKPTFEKTFSGTLSNSPVTIPLEQDSLVYFMANHIYTYSTKEEHSKGII